VAFNFDKSESSLPLLCATSSGNFGWIVQESPAAESAKGSAANDDAMRDGWMKGKLHPITGQPLRCERLELPPGSLICCNTHGPHRVSPTAPGLKPRLAMSLFASKAEADTGFVQPSSTLPPLWALKSIRGELPSTLARFFANGTDRALTGGRQSSTDDPDADGEVIYSGGGSVRISGDSAQLNHANPAVRAAAAKRIRDQQGGQPPHASKGPA
jgi:hypothetical protein